MVENHQGSFDADNAPLGDADKATFGGELAPENAPLAWLVGTWLGGGVLSYENITPAAYLHQLSIVEIEANPYLRVESNLWVANEDWEVVDKELPGHETFAQLTKDYLWSTSVGYLRVNPQQGKRIDGASELEAMIASPAGTAQTWIGLVKQTRMTLITDAVAQSAAGANLLGAKLTTGMVDGDLFYAYDMEAFGMPMQNYLAGRLTKAHGGRA